MGFEQLRKFLVTQPHLDDFMEIILRTPPIDALIRGPVNQGAVEDAIPAFALRDPLIL
jgi:hypothetical protein